MSPRFFRPRTIWCPTRLGWVVLLALAITPPLFWIFKGEDFLSVTEKVPSEILVVEGWIGREGLEAAKVEFERGGYRYLVTGGGLSNNDWDHHQWNYAREAGGLMIRLGVPAAQVIEAPAEDTKTQRTFATALAVRQTLEARGLHPRTLTVFTVGAHARRSRLVFSKVMPAETRVGAIASIPSTYQPGPWWNSSARADTFIKETVGYLYELLLNSGRTSNSSAQLRP